MPYYKETLLSAWPPTTVCHVGKPYPKVPQEVLETMKMIDFVGYAQNPGYKRNTNLDMNLKAKDLGSTGPKFRSEQAREKIHGYRSGSSSVRNSQVSICLYD